VFIHTVDPDVNKSIQLSGDEALDLNRLFARFSEYWSLMLLTTKAFRIFILFSFSYSHIRAEHTISCCSIESPAMEGALNAATMLDFSSDSKVSTHM